MRRRNTSVPSNDLLGSKGSQEQCQGCISNIWMAACTFSFLKSKRGVKPTAPSVEGIRSIGAYSQAVSHGDCLMCSVLYFLLGFLT